MVKGHDSDDDIEYDILALVPFFQAVLQLKSVKRAGWISKVKVENAESVADHTFSMCAMAMLLSDILGLDTHRVVKMAILHDLAESIVGDYMPGDVTARQKMAEEKRAMKLVLAGLPKAVRLQYEKIWLEYLQNKTDIAKFVHRIDKLEMAFQADWYAKQGYAEKLLAPFFESAKAAAATIAYSSKERGEGVVEEDDIVTKILKALRQMPAK